MLGDVERSSPDVGDVSECFKDLNEVLARKPQSIGNCQPSCKSSDYEAECDSPTDTSILVCEAMVILSMLGFSNRTSHILRQHVAGRSIAGV